MEENEIYETKDRNQQGSMPQSIMPVIDMEEVQKAANEYAMQGIRKALQNFYEGYNSPFIKAITEQMSSQVPSFTLDLTGVMALLNEALVSTMDEVVNQAVAKSYIPLVRKLLTRSRDKVKVSEIVKEFIDTYSYLQSRDEDNFTVLLKKDQILDWYELTLESEKDEVNIQITLHTDDKPGTGEYKIICMPGCDEFGNRFGRMKCTFNTDDGKPVVMEMPYGYGILRNNFLRFIANIVTFQIPVIIDKYDFDDIINGFEDKD